MDDDFRRAALDYHRLPRPGKLQIEPTKRMATQRDLALAYSPGVAAACEAIAADPKRFCDVVAALEPTFGAINLEDIKAPECFAIEAELRARMRIPVFHDDQHGTAITVAAAVRNGLLLQGKDLADVKLVTSGVSSGYMRATVS